MVIKKYYRKLLSMMVLLVGISLYAQECNCIKDSIMHYRESIDRIVFQPVHEVFDTTCVNIKKIEGFIADMESWKMNNLSKCKKRKNKALLCCYIYALKQFMYYSDFRMIHHKAANEQKQNDSRERNVNWSAYYEPQMIHEYLDRYIQASMRLNKMYHKKSCK